MLSLQRYMNTKFTTFALVLGFGIPASVLALSLIDAKAELTTAQNRYNSSKSAYNTQLSSALSNFDATQSRAISAFSSNQSSARSTFLVNQSSKSSKASSDRCKALQDKRTKLQSKLNSSVDGEDALQQISC